MFIILKYCHWIKNIGNIKTKPFIIIKKLKNLFIYLFILYPKRVYWDGFPFILIQGAFNAASV